MKPSKTTGAIFKEFWNDDNHWNTDRDDCTYVEEDTLIVDGVSTQDRHVDVDDIPDNAVVEIEYGFVLNPKFGRDGQTLDAYFRLWLKRKNTRIVSFEVEMDKAEELIAFAKTLKAKVF